MDRLASDAGRWDFCAFPIHGGGSSRLCEPFQGSSSHSPHTGAKQAKRFGAGKPSTRFLSCRGGSVGANTTPLEIAQASGKAGLNRPHVAQRPLLGEKTRPRGGHRSPLFGGNGSFAPRAPLSLVRGSAGAARYPTPLSLFLPRGTGKRVFESEGGSEAAAPKPGVSPPGDRPLLGAQITFHFVKSSLPLPTKRTASRRGFHHVAGRPGIQE